MKILLVFSIFISLIECVIADEWMNEKSDELIDALIIGSAESPDPILIRINELKKNEIVKDVVILESFPVQIHLKATKEVIEELNNMPRIEGKLY